MGLESIIDQKTGYNHVRPVKGEHLLWEVVFGKGMQRGSITNNYQPCNFTSVEKLPDGTQQAVLGWKNMRWWKENNTVSVRFIINLPPNCGEATWRIFVHNRYNQSLRQAC